MASPRWPIIRSRGFDLSSRPPLISRVLSAAVALMLGTTAPASATDWVTFNNETASRSDAPAALFVDDDQEKRYAVGDVDNDGDPDLMVVRKEPFTTSGKRVNLLLMNEGGVLVDRTTEFAGASDVPGDLGFNTPTSDRDVQLADLNGDGWLDVVTAATLSDDDPKHIGHPRVYINLGEDPDTGEWLGFEHQDGRIPLMLSYSGSAAYRTTLRTYPVVPFSVRPPSASCSLPEAGLPGTLNSGSLFPARVRGVLSTKAGGA